MKWENPDREVKTRLQKDVLHQSSVLERRTQQSLQMRLEARLHVLRTSWLATVGLCSLFGLLFSGSSLLFALSAGSRYGSYYQRKARTSYFLGRPAPSEWGQGWGLQPAWVSRGNHGLPGAVQGQSLSPRTGPQLWAPHSDSFMGD